MKLVIEIDDVALRNAVESQVGIAMSKLTTEVIQHQTVDIIKKKFDHLDVVAMAERKVQTMLQANIERIISDSFGTHSRVQTIRDMVALETRKLIKGVL